MTMKTSAANKQTITALSHLLADTYLLYTKTQNYHWNVISPHFFAYHTMFEEQYKQLAEAIDTIAERIRALNEQAPASLTEFLKLTAIKETTGTLSAEKMIQSLLVDHEYIAQSIANSFAIVEACGDEVTLDLLIERKAAHDKTAWMLRSTV